MHVATYSCVAIAMQICVSAVMHVCISMCQNSRLQTQFNLVHTNFEDCYIHGYSQISLKISKVVSIIIAIFSRTQLQLLSQLARWLAMVLCIMYIMATYNEIASMTLCITTITCSYITTYGTLLASRVANQLDVMFVVKN